MPPTDAFPNYVETSDHYTLRLCESAAMNSFAVKTSKTLCLEKSKYADGKLRQTKLQRLLSIELISRETQRGNLSTRGSIGSSAKQSNCESGHCESEQENAHETKARQTRPCSHLRIGGWGPMFAKEILHATFCVQRGSQSLQSSDTLCFSKMMTRENAEQQKGERAIHHRIASADHQEALPESAPMNRSAGY